MLLGGLLTACGSSGGGANSITLYNGQHPETTDALVSAFEKATGINVEVESNDEDFQANEIVQEGSHSPADVFFTENSQPLEHLQEKGLLAPVNASTLAHTPSRFNSPLGDWVGVTARVSVIVYNPSLIEKSQLPTHVLQLADPAYKGKLAIAPGETDFQPIVTSVDRAYGEARTLKWLRGIKANSNRPQGYELNEDLTSAVNDGEAAFGIINQYYWYRLRAQVGVSNMHSEIAYFAAGDPGYVIDVSGAAVLNEQPPGGRREVPSLHHLQGRSGDHRPLDELRVPDRLGGDNCATGDPVRSIASVPHHDRRAGRRPAGRGVLAGSGGAVRQRLRRLRSSELS